MMMGLGLGLTMQRGGGGFSLPALFSDQTGVWSVNRDGDVMFTDNAGTTPAPDAGSVGLRLDQSRQQTFEARRNLLTWTDALDNAAWTKLQTSVSANSASAPDGTMTADTITPSGISWAVTQSISGLASGQNYTVSKYALSASETAVQLLNESVGSPDLAINTGWQRIQSSKVASGSSGSFGIRRKNIGSLEPVVAWGAQLELGPAATDYQPVDALPRSWLGNHATEASPSFRPTRSATNGLTYDGIDDRLRTTFNPTTAGSIIARFNGTLASRIIMGSSAASNGRGWLGLDASGRLAAGIGEQSSATIFGGSDLRGAWHVGAVTWDGSIVRLYVDGAEVYSGAQVGAVNTTVPMTEGAVNANGTATAFWGGSISDAIAISKPLSLAEIINITNFWSA